MTLKEIQREAKRKRERMHNIRSIRYCVDCGILAASPGSTMCPGCASARVRP